MNNVVKNLIPLSAFVFVAALLTSGLTLLIVLMAAVGFGGGMPFFYFQKLGLPAIVIGLPIVGMIIFGAILLGRSGWVGEITAGKGVENRSISKPATEGEQRFKAA